MRRWLLGLVLVTAAAGCSSTGGRTSSPPPSTDAAGVQHYVAAVNALCQQLLPKILAVTHDGDPSAFTVAQYEASVPAHTALERDFDAHVAAVPVPAGAGSAHAAFQAYVAFANQLDAKRLAAARRGQAAFEAEIAAEDAAYPTSAVKQARDAAGFDSSCDAR